MIGNPGIFATDGMSSSLNAKRNANYQISGQGTTVNSEGMMKSNYPMPPGMSDAGLSLGGMKQRDSFPNVLPRNVATAAAGGMRQRHAQQ